MVFYIINDHANKHREHIRRVIYLQRKWTFSINPRSASSLLRCCLVFLHIILPLQNGASMLENFAGNFVTWAETLTRAMRKFSPVVSRGAASSWRNERANHFTNYTTEEHHGSGGAVVVIEKLKTVITAARSLDQRPYARLVIARKANALQPRGPAEQLQFQAFASSRERMRERSAILTRRATYVPIKSAAMAQPLHLMHTWRDSSWTRGI